MRKISVGARGGAAAALMLWAGGTVAGQQGDMPHTHIEHVMNRWSDTPDQRGLLPTAMAEAKIAAQHAALAAKSSDNLDRTKLHAGHVLHAVDPSVKTSGPGLGYGVTRAAAGTAKHVTLAANSDGASQSVKTHAIHVSTAATNTIMRAEQVVVLARKILAAITVNEAFRLVGHLETVSRQLVVGADANRDGRIGWQEGESGLEQATQYMGFMKQGKGLD